MGRRRLSDQPGQAARTVWDVLGIVLAVLLCTGGLALVGTMVLFFVGLHNWGSNK